MVGHARKDPKEAREGPSKRQMLQLPTLLEESADIDKEEPTRPLVFLVAYMNDKRHCTLNARSLHAHSTLMTHIIARLQNTMQNHKYDVMHKKEKVINSFLLSQYSETCVICMRAMKRAMSVH